VCPVVYIVAQLVYNVAKSGMQVSVQHAPGITCQCDRSEMAAGVGNILASTSTACQLA
jgi:hypothetical protein